MYEIRCDIDAAEQEVYDTSCVQVQKYNTLIKVIE